MAWTAPSASDPVNDNLWVGGCSNLDIFSPGPPDEPTDIVNDVFLLEGFEFPVAAYNTADGTMWDCSVASNDGMSISTNVRSATKTGGHCLQVAATATVGSRTDFYYTATGPKYQYLRCYFNITAWTNTNGSHRSNVLFGWVSGSGYRSSCQIDFAATSGTAPHIRVAHDTPGLESSTVGSVALSLNTWYRVEMTTESLTSGVNSGMNTTVTVYLGDTTTVVDTVHCRSFGTAMGGQIFVGTGTTAANNAVTVLFDDLRAQSDRTVLDTSAVSNAPLYGPGGIWAMVPKSDLSVEWSPLSGTNFSNVDESPVAVNDGDTSYISASGSSALTDIYRPSFYPVATFPSSNKVINAVLVANVQKNTSGSSRRTNAAYMDTFGTVYTGRNFTSSGSAYQISEVLFLMYDTTPLRVELAGQQGLGIYFSASGVAGTQRCTMVYGYLDIADVS